MHTCKQWKTDYLIQIDYQLHWMVKWDMRGSNHSYLFRAFRRLWKLVPSFSLDRGSTWERNPKSKSVKWTLTGWDNLLFKSDLMPLLIPLPFPGTQRVGVSIDLLPAWARVCSLPETRLLHYTLNVWSRGKQLVLFSRGSWCFPRRSRGKTKLTSFPRDHTLSVFLFFYI